MSGSFGKSIWPIVGVFIIAAAPLIFIAGLVLGVNYSNDGSLIGGSISDWITASATVSVTALTFVLAKESWQLRLLQIAQLKELQKESIRPNVSVGLEGSHVGMNFMNLKIVNMGKGVACNVKFSIFSKDGVEVKQGEDKIADKFFKLGLFRKGMQSIGINQVITSYVLNFHQLGGELNGRIFEPFICIKVFFEDVCGEKYENSFIIDFAEFEGLSEIGGSPIYNISLELKKIREQLGKSLGVSNGRFGVDIFTDKDRNRERAELEEWMEEQRLDR